MTTTAPLPVEDLAAAWITPAEFRALAPSQRRRATLAFVAEHRTRWDQQHWANPEHPCGTAHCIGGWATVLGGAKTIDPDRLLEQGEQTDWWVQPEPGDDPDSIVALEVYDDLDGDGTAWIDAATPYGRAANLLQLTSMQAAYLFRGTNSINDLRVLTCAINAGIADDSQLASCCLITIEFDNEGIQLNDFGARAIVDRVLNA